MPLSKIKKIVSEKGFGFIAGDTGKDVFFHHSAVANHAFDELKVGQTINFELDRDEGGKGPRASLVMPLNAVQEALIS